MLLCVLAFCHYHLEIAAKIFLTISLILVLTFTFDFPRALVFATIFASILAYVIVDERILLGYSFRVGFADLIVLLQICMFLIYRSVNPEKPGAKDVFVVPMVLFLIGVALSFSVATDRSVSFYYFCLLLSGYLFYRFIILVFNTEQDIKLLAFGSIAALVFVIVRAFVLIPATAQARAGIFLANRTGFVFSGPNGLAGILVLLLPFTFIVFHYRNLALKILMAVVFILGTYLLMRTYSRNGYISFIVSMLVMTAMLVRIKGKFVFVALFVIGVPMMLIGATFIMRLFSVTMFQLDPSALLRLIMWKSALNAFGSFPITGVGLGNFYYATRIVKIGFCHNFYLNTLAETGILGGLSLVVLLIMVFYKLSRAYRQLNDGFIKHLSVCLIGSWTSFSLNHIFDQVCFFIDRTAEMKFFWFLLGTTCVFLMYVRRLQSEALK